MWIPFSYIRLILITIFIGYGLLFGLLQPVALIAILILCGLAALALKTTVPPWLNGVGFILLILFSLALGTHQWPGFMNWGILENISLSADSAHFSIWFNYDKPLIGFFILVFLSQSLISKPEQWITLYKQMIFPAALGILIVYLLGLTMGYAQIDITFTSIFWIWAIKNLIFTVVAEEAFFRALIQRQLCHYFVHVKFGKYLALLIASLLFGIAHFAGGFQYVILSSIAGLVYGYVYLITGRIEASILIHFALNAGHFLFFTYPFALQP